MARYNPQPKDLVTVLKHPFPELSGHPAVVVKDMGLKLLTSWPGVRGPKRWRRACLINYTANNKAVVPLRALRPVGKV